MKSNVPKPFRKSQVTGLAQSHAPPAAPTGATTPSDRRSRARRAPERDMAPRARARSSRAPLAVGLEPTRQGAEARTLRIDLAPAST